VSQKDLAELAGVTKMAISKALQAKLKPAAVGDRIHLDHPVVVTYLERKRAQRERVLAKPLPPAERRPGPRGEEYIEPLDPTGEADDAEQIPDEDRELLRNMADKYGGRRAFRDWLDALKRIEDIRKLRLDNDETEGRLIARELVEKYVFAAIESSHLRLLRDLPKSAALRVLAAFKAGGAAEEGERLIRELVATQLKPVRGSVNRALDAG
jgi:transcriptional regulator with XRE-family HTH domain